MRLCIFQEFATASPAAGAEIFWGLIFDAFSRKSAVSAMAPPKTRKSGKAGFGVLKSVRINAGNRLALVGHGSHALSRRARHMVVLPGCAMQVAARGGVTPWSAAWSGWCWAGSLGCSNSGWCHRWWKKDNLRGKMQFAPPAMSHYFLMEIKSRFDKLIVGQKKPLISHSYIFFQKNGKVVEKLVRGR